MARFLCSDEATHVHDGHNNCHRDEKFNCVVCGSTHTTKNIKGKWYCSKHDAMSDSINQSGNFNIMILTLEVLAFTNPTAKLMLKVCSLFNDIKMYEAVDAKVLLLRVSEILK